MHLLYVSDSEPGLRRRGRKRFRYVDERTGKTLRDAGTMARIAAIAIPPAWTEVWICADERGHIQATGRDAKGRKQYRYHPGWHAHRGSAKFDQLRDFGRRLGALRASVDEDLSRSDLSHEQVVALVVALLDVTALRVGSEVYARQNGTYGLTTLRDRHARIGRGTIRLRFQAKHGKLREISCADPRLARLAKRCQDLPGQMLFQYVGEDGAPRPVRSAEVNDYLRRGTGLDVTSKTFRTWEASVQTAELLAPLPVPSSERRRLQVVKQIIEQVAASLGNTVAVCRASYVHPLILESWEHGGLEKAWRRGPRRARAGLDASERRLLRLLEGALARS